MLQSLTLLLLLIATPAIAAFPTAMVVSVGDGDTLQVRQNNSLVTIRLACVDAPELAQSPYGAKSAERLKQLLPMGQTVQLREVGMDRYGRTVAEVFFKDQSIGLQLVREGYAVVYPQYLNRCQEKAQQYLQAEKQSKSKKLVFWQQTSPVMPWDFRQEPLSTARPIPPNTQPTPAVQPTAPQQPTASQQCSASYPDICLPDPPPDLDCRNIPFRRFRVLPPDPHRLDGDRDGIGCER